MTVWFALALMTAAAIFAVLWPLARRGQPLRSGSDVAVYRDQLDEIDRDRAAGRIEDSEAIAAQVEVSRRLIAAADAQAAAAPAASATWRRRAVGHRRARAAAARRRGALSRARLALPAGSAAHDPPCGLHPEPIDRAPDCAGRDPPRRQPRRRPRLGGDRTGLSAARPRGRRREGAAQRAPAERGDRRASDRARRDAGLRRQRHRDRRGEATFERAVALDQGDVKARYFLGSPPSRMAAGRRRR